MLVAFACIGLSGCDGGEEFSSEMDKALKEAEKEMAGAVAEAAKDMAAASASADGGTMDVVVTLNEKKPNGKAWDALGGKPDVALCYTSGGSKKCIPGGGDTVKAGDPAHCQDALSCTFSVPVGASSFEVYDVDMASNDSVGSGTCAAGNTCQFESCSITLGGMGVAKGAAVAPGKGGLAVGSRVSCNWKSGGVFYNGTITKKNGDAIHISYDDGDQEDTVVSKCKLIGAASKRAFAAPAAAAPAAAAPAAASPDAVAARAPQAAPKPKPKYKEYKYPVPCKKVDMSRHVTIKKDEEWCVPSHPAHVAIAGGSVMPSMPSGYSDNNEIALLSSPNKKADESSSLTSSERKKLAKDVKAKIFYTNMWSSMCENSFVDANGKLSANCDIAQSSLYSGSAPSVKKTTNCETIEGCTVDDPCSSHDDCDGWLCGCSQSRCTIWGVCTRCPSDRECDDPEYDLKTKDWKLSAKFKKEAKASAKDFYDNQSSYKFFMAYKLSSLWRKVSTAKECEEDYDGKRVCETVVADDTGYYGKITPLYAGFMKCDGSDCTVANSKDPVDLKNSTFSVTLENQGHKAKVTCKKGACTAKQAK